jgi:KDO2-lipid IV(A) lauroyltransferase
MGRYAVDFLREGPLPPHRIHNEQVIDQLFGRGKGIIVLLAHYGNWELLASIFGAKIKDLNVIAMPMRNPLVEQWLLRKRTAAAVSTIHTKKALRKIYTVLKRNGMAATLVDQFIKNMGTPAPFLGKEASTVRTVAGLAFKTGAAVMPARAVLAKDGSYDVYFEEAPLPPRLENEDDESYISKIQAQHNDIISQWISDSPEHWFGWFHKRFKMYVSYSAPLAK